MSINHTLLVFLNGKYHQFRLMETLLTTDITFCDINLSIQILVLIY